MVSKSFVLSCLYDSLPRPGRAWQHCRTRAGSPGCTTTWWLSPQVNTGSSSPRAGTAACSLLAPACAHQQMGTVGWGQLGTQRSSRRGLQAGHTDGGSGESPGRGAVPSATWQSPCPAQGLDVSLLFLLTHSGWDRKPPQNPTGRKVHGVPLQRGWEIQWQCGGDANAIPCTPRLQ